VRALGAAMLEHRMPAPVLLVEADPAGARATVEVFERALGRQAWVCHEPDLEMALRLLRAFTFRLIVFDPGGLGGSREAALEALTLAAGQTPCILVSHPLGTPAAADPAPPRPAVRMSAATVTVPPGEPDALVAAVRRHLQLPGPG
jgi:hypothetical protein